MIRALLAIWLLAPQQTPPSTAARVLTVARTANSEAQLTALAKAQSDTLREALTQALKRAAFASTPTERNAELGVARRLGQAYAAAWSDPFLTRQVARFEQSNRQQQHAKVKADSLRKAGALALGQLGAPAAIALWRASLQQARVAGDSASQGAALGNIGVGFYRAGELDSARIYLTRAQRLATIAGDQRTAANAIGVLASVHKERGELARAVELYTTASNLRERSGDSGGVADDQNNLGLIARDMGDLDGATRFFQRALALNQQAGRVPASALNLLNLAGSASMRGDYARAEQLYGQAFTLNSTAGESAENAYVLHERALLRVKRGDYSGAEADLRVAVQLHDRSGALHDATAARLDLAAVLMAIGSPQDALTLLRHAETQARTAGAPASLRGDIARASAELQVGLNQLEAARDDYATAEKLYRSEGDDVGLGQIAEGRAFLLYSDHDYKGALVALEVAQRAHDRSGDARAVALTHISIGYASMQLSDTIPARRNIVQAQHALRELGDVIGEASAQLALGDLAMLRRTPVMADRFYRAGLQTLGTRTAGDVRWRLHAGLGTALRQQRAVAAAGQQLQLAIAEIERASGTLGAAERRVGFMADKLDVYAQLALLQRETRDLAAAFATSERMRAQHTLALLAQGRVAATPRSAREQDLRRQISELMSQVDDDGAVPSGTREAGSAQQVSASAREALYRAQAAYARLLTEITEQDPAYANVVRPSTVTATAIARRLRADEVMIDYLVTDSTVLAFVISTRGTSLVDLGVSRSTLAPLIDFAVRVTQKQGLAASNALWRAPLARLYKYLIAPIESAGYLQGKSALIIVPHSELHFVPFAALINAQRGSFLINDWHVSYAPSASAWSLLRARVAARKKGVVAVAPRTDVLRFSEAEVREVRRIHGRRTTVLAGPAASLSALRNALPHTGIVHLATLGVLNKHNPLFSFIELAGKAGKPERLEVHEVFGLALSGQLIVLSACQTALGSGALADVPPGDDWTGLVQAFLAAGAGSVVATQWPVNDRATAQLMGAFHKAIRDGKRDAAALAQAQRAAIRNRATAHPFYWAAFTVHSGS